MTTEERNKFIREQQADANFHKDIYTYVDLGLFDDADTNAMILREYSDLIKEAAIKNEQLANTLAQIFADKS